MCEDCGKSPLLNCAMGTGKICGHTTTPQGNAYCVECAKRKHACIQCGKKIKKD